MKTHVLVSTGVAALLLVCHAQSAHATTLVATIYGEYEPGGISDLPSSVTAGKTGINSAGVYDTPALFFVNPTSFDITAASFVLSVGTAQNNGQNTLNNGANQTVNIANIPANSILQVTWGSGGPIFTSDYDDKYSSNNGAGLAGNIGSFAADCTLNAPGNHTEWTNFCAPTGSFQVAFSGTWNAQNVASVFDERDVNGHYTGWQGLDPNGWSENLTYDVHLGTVQGVLANIYVGTVDTVPTNPTSDVPEPGTLTLLGSGLGALAFARWRRKVAYSRRPIA